MTNSGNWAVFLIVLASLLARPSSVGAQCAATAAEMGFQFEIFRVADLQVTPIDFGSILINDQPGRIDMDSGGSLSISGGVLQISGFPQAGSLTLNGDGVIATITLDPEVNMGDGVLFSPMASATSVSLTGNAETIYIYGTLELPAATASNHYSGVLHINVTYN